MKNPAVSRRDFMKQSALVAAALRLPAMLDAAVPVGGGVVPKEPAVDPTKGAELHWIDGAVPKVSPGTTWGVPWPRGAHRTGTSFALNTAAGEAVPVQSWPLATWPDGSLKWTAHALGADAGRVETLRLTAGAAAVPKQAIAVTETEDFFEIHTGVMRCRVARRGSALITELACGDRTVARNGRLVLVRQDRAEAGAEGVVHTENFTGEMGAVTVEQSGPVRAVVKVEGKHANGAGRAWLPFTVRLYFYAGSEAVRVMHTIVFDGDEQKDFIRGLGVRFTMPLSDPLHDRHVRFVGEAGGLFAEAVRGLTGLRRDPGVAVTSAQLAGRATPPVAEWPRPVRAGLPLIPAFGDYTLFQGSADSFEIRKRTADGHAWLASDHGRRAAGTGYLGGPSGGVAFGVKNFWQSHPTALEIRGAATETAEVTLWLWSPDARPMDLRFYHDGMGQDTYAKQLAGLDITYEDYEPGFGTPMGVARTSELMLWALPATPTRERLVELAEVVSAPPRLMCTPGYLSATGVFGGMWSPVDRSSEAKAKIEDQLDWLFGFYRGQIDQRRWYGFWNFGDVMHSYDRDRHVWKYDVGGFAWDNSELSTDLWLWSYFLKTGKAEVFRMAEAMTRHTGEVDVHHLGRFAPLGSRHNVMHWGCSAKQLRISTAANRRYYYFLTGDERVGDLMREQVHADRALRMVQPNRKVAREGVPEPDDTATVAQIGFGTDWGALAAAWLTEWERTGDAAICEKLLNSMWTIAAQPRGFFSSGGRMELETGKFAISTNDRASASHLSSVFGLVEMCAELVQLVEMPEFERAWVSYCTLYNATPEEQERALGRSLGSLNLRQGHARLTAFAARRTGDAKLAARAWGEFYEGTAGYPMKREWRAEKITGPAVLNPIDEAAWVSTNGSAQWGLAAIQCLALVGEQMPGEK